MIATQNPIEYEGTYPLPEAQLDRFILRSRVGYPTLEHERELLQQRIERAADEVEISTGRRRADAASRCSARSSWCTSSEPDRRLHRAARAGDARQPARPGRRQPARGLALLKLSRGKAVLEAARM